MKVFFRLDESNMFYISYSIDGFSFEISISSSIPLILASKKFNKPLFFNKTRPSHSFNFIPIICNASNPKLKLFSDGIEYF